MIHSKNTYNINQNHEMDKQSKNPVLKKDRVVYWAGWWFEPLWNIWKSIGMIIPNIWENKIDVPNHQPEKIESFIGTSHLEDRHFSGISAAKVTEKSSTTARYPGFIATQMEVSINGGTKMDD